MFSMKMYSNFFDTNLLKIRKFFRKRKDLKYFENGAAHSGKIGLPLTLTYFKIIKHRNLENDDNL